MGDARSEAKRHFREGMALIAKGQLESGIAQLQQAYAIKPHRDLLYNIARAYLDLGRIPEALDYFGRYVATNPPDRARVDEVIARLSAATAPPQPAAPASPPVDTAKLVAALQELIERNKAAEGAKPAGANSKPDEGMFEPTPVTGQSRATAQEIASSLQASRTDEGMFDEQVVSVASPSAVAADEQRFQCAVSTGTSQTSCWCWWTDGACGTDSGATPSGRCSTCRCTTSPAAK